MAFLYLNHVSIKGIVACVPSTIPLSLFTQLDCKLQGHFLKHIACGFGVGLSWGVYNLKQTMLFVPNL